MYYHLNGTLIEKTPTSVILDVGGVGYHLTIPLSTFSSLPAIGESSHLLTHFVVREDAHLLFGFASAEERDLFRLLISITGVGPKLAISILSGREIGDVKQAIVNGSIEFLTGISGIGRKTAERIVIELREKIVVQERRVPGKGAGLPSGDQAFEDCLQALLELGYRKQNARSAIEKVLSQSNGTKMDAESLIRASLKYV